MSRDHIIIRDLEVFYAVGVTEAERAQPQRLLLTVEMTADLRGAALADDLGRTIDYFAVSQRLLRFGDGRSWKLIESLASEVAAAMLTEFRPVQVTVEVKKFVIPQSRYVSVRLQRP
jgi:FolB domain-containing protein